MQISINIPDAELPEAFQGAEGRQNVIDQLVWLTEAAYDRKIEFLQTEGRMENTPQRTAQKQFLEDELKMAKLIKKHLVVKD